MRPRPGPDPSRDHRFDTLWFVKAITIHEPGAPDVLELTEVPDPEPGPGEIAVVVHGAGLNRADLLQRQGHYPPPPGASEILGLECPVTSPSWGLA